MDWMFESPVNWIAGAVLAAVGAVALWRGNRSLIRGLRNPEHPAQSLWVVRGLRGGILALGLGFLAGGLLTRTAWPLIFGAVFLGEEILETGIMIWALRSGARAEADRARATGSETKST